MLSDDNQLVPYHNFLSGSCLVQALTSPKEALLIHVCGFGSARDTEDILSPWSFSLL